MDNERVLNQLCAVCSNFQNERQILPVHLIPLERLFYCRSFTNHRKRSYSLSMIVNRSLIIVFKTKFIKTCSLQVNYLFLLKYLGHFRLTLTINLVYETRLIVFHICKTRKHKMCFRLKENTFLFIVLSYMYIFAK